ncbi:MAG: DUF3087 family protein [Colwellia sp.]
MQLQFVEKAKYRKHLNSVIFAFIASLLVLSLAYGTLFIKLFSDQPNQIGFMPPEQQTAEMKSKSNQEPVLNNEMISDKERFVESEQAPKTNFRYNLLGVILALITCGIVLSNLRHTAFFKEIYYVWKLKQVHNQIYRKLKPIKQAVKEGDETAMLILSFYYQGLKQVYELDDNTITMGTINRDIDALDEQIKAQGKEVDISTFKVNLLKVF